MGHDHSVHLESQDNSRFAAADPVEDDSSSGNGSLDHEHPPYTATSRGVEMSLRRLVMLEPVYALAPDLLRSGMVVRPDNDVAVGQDPSRPALPPVGMVIPANPGGLVPPPPPPPPCGNPPWAR